MARKKIDIGTRSSGPRVTLSCAEMHGLTFNAAAVEKHLLSDGNEVIVYYDDEEHAFVLERVDDHTAGALRFRKPSAKYKALRLTLRGVVSVLGLDIPDTVPVDVDADGEDIIVRLTPDMTIEE